MRKRWQWYGLLVLLLNMHATTLTAQSVSKVDFSVIGGEKLEISYDLDGGKAGNVFTVSVVVSTDGGRTFSITPKTVTGDIGPNIKSGKNKRITWNVLNDLDELETLNLMVEVRAVPEKKHGTAAGIEFVFVKGGTFDMGDTFGDGDANEKPVHSVTVSDFYMSKTEVTNAQFAAFLNDYAKDTDDQGNAMIYEHDWGIKKVGNRWQPQPGYENHPVVYVTWYGAAQFAKWAGCRLPTEAEWEYAAREGGKNIKWSGTNSQNSLGDYAWYSSNSGGKTHPVGTKKPNALGLYDMSGNVWEWCSDWYDGNYYQNSPLNNPNGSATGTYRTLRGGSWYNDERNCRSSDRSRVNPDFWDSNIGFRVAQDSPQ